MATDKDGLLTVAAAPRLIAIAAGVGFVGFGVWAMLDPRSFFANAALFEPYNQHFLQDIGAFQIGLGAVLLLAAWRSIGDALGVSLLGVGVGAALHGLSHVVGRELGGSPGTDIPLFTTVAVVLLAAGVLRWRQVRRYPR